MNLITIESNKAIFKNGKMEKQIKTSEVAPYIYNAMMNKKRLWIECNNDGSDKFYEVMTELTPLLKRALSESYNNMYSNIVVYVNGMNFMQWLKEDPIKYAYATMKTERKEDEKERHENVTMMYSDKAFHELYNKLGYDTMVEVIKAYAKEYDITFNGLETTNPLTYTHFHNCGEDITIITSEYRTKSRYTEKPNMLQLISAFNSVAFYDEHIEELAEVIYSTWCLENDETIVKIGEYDIAIGKVNNEPIQNLNTEEYIFNKSVRLLHTKPLLKYIKEKNLPCKVIYE